MIDTSHDDSVLGVRQSSWSIWNRRPPVGRLESGCDFCRMVAATVIDLSSPVPVDQVASSTTMMFSRCDEEGRF